MKIVAWIASKTGSVGFLHRPTRYLSRDPGVLYGALILLILTLSLSAFTASLAQTLDNHLFDQSAITRWAAMSIWSGGSR